MTYPWQGAARPLSPGAFDRAAAELSVEPAVIRAVWKKESRGGFRRDRSLERRFEPHHMPRKTWGRIGFSPGEQAPFRAARALTEPERGFMAAAAFADFPDDALRATSWGGPQIMGFNAQAAGFADARAMVAAMADSEDAQLAAFVAFVRFKRLEGALRAHNWRGFTTGYNGNGDVAAYAKGLEALYRKESGKASPVVLRMGDDGPDVAQLQRALGVVDDGGFGPATDAAVRAFQERAGLPVDGVVGARTWAALTAQGAAPTPPVQRTRADEVKDATLDWVFKGGGGAVIVGGTGKAVEDHAPPAFIDAAFWAVGALVLAVAAVHLLRWMRRAA